MLRCEVGADRRGTWVPRSSSELSKVLSAAYGQRVEVAPEAGGLAVVAAALNEGNVALAQIAMLHLRLPDLPVVAKSNGSLPQAGIPLTELLGLSRLFKAEWDPAKHPRTGVPPNPGWFAEVDDEASAAEQQGDFDPNAIVPIADFSGGFHDEVVKQWLDAWRRHGIPAVASPSIRFIGPDGRVQGYPDALIHEPGQPVEAFEIKTGANPTFTPQQRRYIPMLQLGGHIYSNDPRIEALGLKPGVPFPPMRVGVIYTPAPGQKYVVVYLDGPFALPD